MPYKNKKKQHLYQAEFRRHKRRVWLIQNGPCKKCGSWENLQVDHIDRDSKVSHKIWSWSESKRKKELNKCQVLCDECHIHKTLIGNMKRGITYKKGRTPHNKEISDTIVKQIKSKINDSGHTLKEIANMFDVKYQAVRDISAGKSYINV